VSTIYAQYVAVPIEYSPHMIEQMRDTFLPSSFGRNCGGCDFLVTGSVDVSSAIFHLNDLRDGFTTI